MDKDELFKLLEYMEFLDPTQEQQSYIDGMKSVLMALDGSIDWEDALEPLDYLMVQIKKEREDEHREYERNLL